ncbi:MAG TPA: S46 family peptidase [Patescibacteria group bacterium]|nr:S46 family peptidase [Patescibacteria group bacterium]
MRPFVRFTALVVALATAAVSADEGMWPPSQLPAVEAKLKARGLELDAKDLSSLTEYPLNAIVGLGYCTGSFLSPNGLVATNHHCGFGIVQFNSTKEKNLMADGFLAKDFAAELPADPNQRLYVTESISDVTARLTRGMDDVGGLKRYTTIDQRSKQVVAECERDPGYRCDVYNFNGGRNYLMIKQLEIKDVRLVYAPSEQIGNFGGDIDNWMWPRHTGDFTFLRGYVGPDGKPAPFSKDNKPYQPKSWLKVDPKGLQVGDYAMVTGYPGRTNRSRLAEELRDAIEFSYPRGIKNMGESLDTIARVTKDRPDAAIKYASTVQGISNGWKNQQGQLEGFAKTTAVADKEAEEARLLAWIEADAGRKAKYGGAVTALKAELARIRALRETELYGNSLLSSGPTLYGVARDLYKLSRERRKPDAERSFGFQARDEIKFKGRMASINPRFDAGVDRALFELSLGRYLKLAKPARIPEVDRALGIDRDGMAVADLVVRLDALYAGSKLADLNARMALLDAKPRDFEKSADSFVQLAVALYPAFERMETEWKTRAGNEGRYRSAYLDALIAFRESEGRPAYPDANNSLRVTYGTVIGYSPKDGVANTEFTTLEGVLAKVTGADPFLHPKRAVELMKAKHYGKYADPKLGTVPVNFLTNVDITGGNSGSPTLNKRGEVVGLVFDGNWESVSASWVFNPALTRAIHVDIRYMLWIMDEVDQADHLIREMGLEPTP